MAKMIEAMPKVWRIIGRVRGIALYRDRFQFVFQREEDLQTVLEDRRWSYNHWTMVLERWIASSPASFLTSLEVWVRIRNIPMNHYTTKTMDMLGSAIGHVEEIAYDPKVSQTTDFVRARITFDIANPERSTKNLNLPTGEVVVINYEYEKLRKQCFHCHRLTHEKFGCPLLRKGRSGKSEQTHFTEQIEERLGESSKQSEGVNKGRSTQFLEGPPGFPPRFPGLSKEDNRLAVQYISHADATERLARITKVQQSIEEGLTATVPQRPLITKDINKGKGQVFGFDVEETRSKQQHSQSSNSFVSASNHHIPLALEEVQSRAPRPTTSLPVDGTKGFSMGISPNHALSGSLPGEKRKRGRPSKWKRVEWKDGSEQFVLSFPNADEDRGKDNNLKRKAVEVGTSQTNKNPKTQEKTVASDLKPLLSQ
ncbi:hypothetical protein V5N11_002796 [Cardamine amara subsp. amara]|uniref:DUF4283 domain-containing protein n=1 Tax=Cardamine amara subsp. amara TaxID=228776 RepID=A0ABD1C6B5_CARAN